MHGIYIDAPYRYPTDNIEKIDRGCKALVGFIYCCQLNDTYRRARKKKAPSPSVLHPRIGLIRYYSFWPLVSNWKRCMH